MILTLWGVSRGAPSGPFCPEMNRAMLMGTKISVTMVRVWSAESSGGATPTTV